MINELFSGTNFGQKAFLIVEVALVVMILLVTLFRLLANKKLDLNLKRGQISYAPGSKDSVTVENAVSGVFFSTLETVAMMAQIKTKLILHDQMTYLEERLVIIRDTILESYRHAWKNYIDRNGPTEDFVGQEYLFYQSLVDLMKEDMKSSVRVFFLRNHFSTYDDQQLNSYIEEKNELLMVKAYQFLRDMYPIDKMTLSFEEIENGLDKVRPDLENGLSVAFKKAVDITKERHRQIADLETGLRKNIKQQYGVELNGSGVGVFSGTLQKNEEDGRSRR